MVKKKAVKEATSDLTSLGDMKLGYLGMGERLAYKEAKNEKLVAGDMKLTKLPFWWIGKEFELKKGNGGGADVIKWKILVASFLKNGGWPIATKRP